MWNAVSAHTEIRSNTGYTHKLARWVGYVKACAERHGLGQARRESDYVGSGGDAAGTPGKRCGPKSCTCDSASGGLPSYHITAYVRDRSASSYHSTYVTYSCYIFDGNAQLIHLIYKPKVAEGDIMIVPQFIYHYTEPNTINFNKRIISFKWRTKKRKCYCRCYIG